MVGSSYLIKRAEKSAAEVKDSGYVDSSDTVSTVEMTGETLLGVTV